MEIREATWEKRNLGVIAHEFFVGAHEKPADVFPEISSCEAEYQTLHVEWGNTEVLLQAQEEGFRFIEMGVQMELPAKSFACPSMYKRFEPYLSYSIANEDEMQEIIDVVRTGEMFTTDKVARDPFFGKEKSGIRYAYWLQDAVENGAVLILTKYKDTPIGFNSGSISDDGIVTAILGGRFPAFENAGFGFAPLYSLLQWMVAVGGSRMFTNMSSNNLSVIKLHEIFGFTTRTMSYSLIKHL